MLTCISYITSHIGDPWPLLHNLTYHMRTSCLSITKLAFRIRTSWPLLLSLLILKFLAIVAQLSQTELLDHAQFCYCRRGLGRRSLVGRGKVSAQKNLASDAEEIPSRPWKTRFEGKKRRNDQKSIVYKKYCPLMTKCGLNFHMKHYFKYTNKSNTALARTWGRYLCFVNMALGAIFTKLCFYWFSESYCKVWVL